MVLLIVLTLLVLVTSFAVTSSIASRAEAVIAGSLAFNAIVVVPIYVLGLTNHPNELSLGIFVAFVCGLSLGVVALRNAIEHLSRAGVARVGRPLVPTTASRRSRCPLRSR